MDTHPIEEANDLSVRSYNILKNLGIDTFEQVCHLNRKSLLKLRNAGPKSVAEIELALTNRGLSLAPNITARPSALSMLQEIKNMQACRKSTLELLRYLDFQIAETERWIRSRYPKENVEDVEPEA